MKLEFCREIFEKNGQIPNLMKIRPVGVELFYADRRTCRDKETGGKTDFFPWRNPLVGQDPLIIKASQSHSDIPHSVERHWASDQPAAETSPYQ
jgi:hypothetical protein